MKFLYKIYSGYDGFTPSRIPDRMIAGDFLQLGWQRYIDVVNIGEEVWVYFFGRHNFENGVYVKGIVSKINAAKRLVFIRIRQYSTDQPLTDAATSLRIASAVATRNVQVFLLPTEWAVAPECTVDAAADSCRNRQCESCPTWQGLPRIANENCGWPQRLSHRFTAFAPAFWVIPSRGYLRGRNVAEPIRRVSELFYRFKMGEGALAFPLALGIYAALAKQKILDFDCVIPIPLSPDKEKAGEINRTRLLAKELGALLGVKVVEVLSLNQPISKRRLLSAGYTSSQFEHKYYQSLEVEPDINKFVRVLVVDDVCTQGTTLSCALRRITDIHPTCEVAATTAGQMILKAVVKNDKALRA